MKPKGDAKTKESEGPLTRPSGAVDLERSGDQAPPRLYRPRECGEERRKPQLLPTLSSSLTLVGEDYQPAFNVIQED